MKAPTKYIGTTITPTDLKLLNKILKYHGEPFRTSSMIRMLIRDRAETISSMKPKKAKKA